MSAIGPFKTCIIGSCLPLASLEPFVASLCNRGQGSSDGCVCRAGTVSSGGSRSALRSVLRSALLV
jgi:hypothetical protein